MIKHDAPIDIEIIYQQNLKYLRQAQKMYAENRPQYAINEILKKIHESPPTTTEDISFHTELKALIKQMEWDSKREANNKTFINITFDLQNKSCTERMLYSLQSCQKDYINYIDCLNEQELQYKEQIVLYIDQAKRLLEREDNIHKQEKINAAIVELKNDLAAYNISGIHYKLQRIIDDQKEITRQEDIIETQTMSIQTLEQDLITLQAIEAQYNDRSIRVPLNIARRVILNQNCGLYIDYQTERRLRDILYQALHSNWQLLDGNNLDQITEGLISIIDSKKVSSSWAELLLCCTAYNFRANLVALTVELDAFIKANPPENIRQPLKLGLLGDKELIFQGPTAPSVPLAALVAEDKCIAAEIVEPSSELKNQLSLN